MKVSIGKLPDYAGDKKAFYIVKNVEGNVGNPYEELDYGIIPPNNANALVALERVLNDIYIPILRRSEEENIKGAEAKAKSAESNSGSDKKMSEFGNKMKQFAGQVSLVIQKVSGNVKLPVPDLVIDAKDVRKAANTVETVNMLRPVLDEWNNLIVDVLDNEMAKSRRNETPIGEIDLWKDRNATLSALYEQITMPNIRIFVKVLELAEVMAIDNFKKYLELLMKRYIEAKDNVKFLSTLERHFKNIESGKLSTILDTIPSMMESLRMVWIISRHYNRDERMFPLLQLIASQLAERVEKEITVTRILSHRPEPEAMNKIKLAISVLERWFSSFQEVKRQIAKDSQNSGMAQWNFERKLLFDKTNYMIGSLHRLHSMVKTCYQFRNFLGKELQNVTGDPHTIERVRRTVENLIAPVKAFPFSIFDERKRKQWQDVGSNYEESVKDIEEACNNLIHESFKKEKLESSEEAFELLQKFKDIDTLPSIRQTMTGKTAEVLKQYLTTIASVEEAFHAGVDNPPITRNQPKIAGTIGWLRSMFFKIKTPILKFIEMKNPPKIFEEVKRRYKEVAKKICAREDAIYNKWCTESEQNTKKRLKDPILICVDVTVGQLTPAEMTAHEEAKKQAAAARKNTKRSGHSMSMSIRMSKTTNDESSIGMTLKSSKRTSASSTMRQSSKAFGLSTRGVGMSSTHTKKANEVNVIVPKITATGAKVIKRLRVNFSDQLNQVIKESKYLSRMGKKVPDIAFNVALQEQKYLGLVEQLDMMLKNFREALSRLSEVESQLFSRHIQQIHKTMSQGCDRLNWTSLATETFIKRCNNDIAKFSISIDLVQKKAKMILKNVAEIQNSQLIEMAHFSNRAGPLAINVVKEIVERNLKAVVDKMVKLHKDIPQILIQMEGDIDDSKK